MWDVRNEKPFGCHWLTGMDEGCAAALSLLFKHYGRGDESCAEYAMRLAGIK